MQTQLIDEDKEWGSEWTRVADVVVVGSGVAGLTAAVQAARAGSTVLVLERALLAGGTTAKSGGVLWIPNNRYMRARGLVDDRSDAIRYMAKSAYPTHYNAQHPSLGLPPEKLRLIETFYDMGHVAIDALVDDGVLALEEIFYPDYYADMPEDTAPVGRALKPLTWEGFRRGIDKLEGQILIDQLLAACEKLGVQFQTDSRVLQLLKDPQGEVIGAEVRAGRRTELMGARQGIVFATGGFLHNPKLALEYLRGPVMGGAACEGSTGDFIPMATALGASLGNMTHAWWSQLVLELALRNRSTLRDVYSPYGDSMLMVNRHGKRVMNEKATYNERGQVHFHWDAGAREYPNHLLFWLFDDALVNNPQPSRFQFPIPTPGETLDYVISAPTWAQLAAKVSVRLQQLSPHTGGVTLDNAFQVNLQATLERFNTMALAGNDLDFARGESPIEKAWAQAPRPGAASGAMHPLSDSGPYHCIILAAAALDTKGGPITDTQARVLDQNDEPIPGLFGAGNCVASPAGQAYWGAGGTIGVALTYGFIAGQQAAQRPRRMGAELQL
ncbi:FAD-dependent oxidoreductase [Rhodoferax lacus]|nr:FAD-dependent oxidoreductase [Rhodoferax lacus]